MDISLDKKDDLNAIITIKLEENDYEPQVVKSLKEYGKRVPLKGFRPGKAPLGMLRQKVGNQIKMEEVDKVVSESLNKYISEEKLQILAQPLTSPNQEPIDIEKEKEFSFKFDIALSPEFSIEIDDSIEIPYYKISVDDDLVQKEIDRYRNQYGSTSEVSTVSDKSYIKANLIQMNDDGSQKESDIVVENVTLSVDIIKDKEIKEKFIGLTEEAELVIDIKKAYPNDTEISSLLSIEKEKVADLNPNFQVYILGITEFKQADIDEDFFKKAFGETVKTEEEMIARIKADIADIYVEEADYRFSVDAKDMLLEKTSFEMPDEFLKRYLVATDQKGELTAEVIEKEYPAFSKNFKLQLIENQIATKIDVKVEIEDLRAESRKHTEMQFRQYGLPLNAISDEHMESFIEKNLESPEERNRFAERVIENKVIAHVKETVKLKETEITMDEFKKLYE